MNGIHQKTIICRDALIVVAISVCGLLSAVCTSINTPADPDTVLTLTANTTAVPADGFSTTTITAHISTQADERFRDVIFTTTLGTFPAADVDSPRRFIASADSDGRAAVSLQSSPQTGTAVVTAEIRDGDAVKVSRAIEVTFEPLKSSDVIEIQAASPTAPADGASTTAIVVKVADAMPLSQRSVLFSTTSGTFGPLSQQATVQAGSNAVAVASLISSRKPSVALVTATVNGRQSQTTVQFEHALPETVTISVFGSLQLKATFATKININVELFRSVGKVTAGTVVRFRAFDDSTGNMFGFFSGVTPSDENGMVVAQFTPGNTIERGEATIRARVEGTGVSEQVKIEIIDP
jgi:hypothetical protein